MPRITGHSRFHIKLKQFILVSLSVLTIVSCTSTKQISKKETEEIPATEKPLISPLYKPQIQSIITSGKFSFKSNQGNFDGSFKISVSRNDSLIVNIIGPFGINIAKLIANKSNFAVCNLWEGKYFASSIDSIRHISPILAIPVSELLKIFIAEPYYSADNYIILQHDTSLGRIQYQSNLSKPFTENLIINRSNIQKTVLIYPDLQVNITFEDYETKFGYPLPKKIVIREDNSQLNIAFEINQFENYNIDFSNEFKIPANLKKINKIEDILK